MEAWILLLLTALWLVAYPRSINKFVSAEQDSISLTCPARRSNSCSLFMANSTIPDGGVGIFTTETLVPGDWVGFGDLMNPLIDLYWHRPVEFMSHDHPFFDYVWEGIGTTNLESADNHEGSVLLMGFGLEAAINCHLALVNTHSAKVEYDDYHAALLHRSQYPGAGAFTPYVSGKTLVAYPIPTGGELFKHYGDDWFVRRTEEFGLVPLSNDYVVADALIQKFGLLFPEAHDPSTLKEMHKDLWDLMANVLYESRTTNAIPKDHDHIPAAIKNGIWEPYIKEAKRSVEEIQRTGRCLDNISHGPSTLKQAGRGAFSVTFLEAGSAITGSPLLHVKSDELFRMYEHVYKAVSTGEDLNDLPSKEETIIRTYQTAINYCWKHPLSTMLLCPYGAGVNYINHKQPPLANVKVQWAPHGEMGHDKNFLDLEFSEIFQTRKARLAFDYVALRDIQEGEELFLDYGIEWERAWQKHVRLFDEVSVEARNSLYTSSRHWNKEYQNTDIIRTDKEQQLKPYPSNLDLRCHTQIASTSLMTAIVPPELRVYNWTRKDVGLSCHVLARRRSKAAGTTLYDVAVEDFHFPVTTTTTTTTSPAAAVAAVGSCIKVKDISRSGLQFFDRPYTTDLHLPRAFRQPIGVPGELFPAAWRNLKGNSTTT